MPDHIATDMLWKDRCMTVVMWLAAAITLAILGWILGDMLTRGMQHLSWSFFLQLPENSGREGGIAPILVSTILILLIALMTSMPTGLACAVWLAEYRRSNERFAGMIRLSLDTLAGVPSIVWGLFGNAFFCIWLDLGFSILSGGLTLACMILPIFIRTCEIGLRTVENDWRFAAAALGMTRASIIWHVLLPAATPAVLAGLMLGIGRATAETAALIFTSGYVDRMPESWFDSGRALAVHIYDLSINITGGDNAAYASSLTLVMMIVLVNVIAFVCSERWLTKRISHA